MSQVAFDFDLDDGGVPTYTVGELAEAINWALRRRFTDGVWVRGEIQGWSERGPHAYFRLVEDDATDGKAADQRAVLRQRAHAAAPDAAASTGCAWPTA